MKITTLQGLHRASMNRRAVLLADNPKPKAAAFIMSMQGRVILRYLQLGITLYRKPAAQAADKAKEQSA